MICTKCGNRITCADTYSDLDGKVYRKRICKTCGDKFYTVELKVKEDIAFKTLWAKLSGGYQKRSRLKRARKAEL